MKDLLQPVIEFLMELGMNVIVSFAEFFVTPRQSLSKGQTLVEYTLILAVMTLIAIGVFALLGARIQLIFSAMTAILDTAQSSH
jgi:Flp pilus assembly pilin Flp